MKISGILNLHFGRAARISHQKDVGASAHRSREIGEFLGDISRRGEPVDGVMRADSEYGEIADGGQYADSFFAYVQADEDGEPEEEGTIFIIK